jgi:hypothetical protein
LNADARGNVKGIHPTYDLPIFISYRGGSLRGVCRSRRFTIKNNRLIFKHLDLITENIYFIVLNCQLIIYLCSHERQFNFTNQK